MSEMKYIYEGELARLRAGLTASAIARRMRITEGAIRAAERAGCCYGTALALHHATGSRMEAYLHPQRVAIPTNEYRALTAEARMIEEKPNKRRALAGARRTTTRRCPRN